MKKTFTIGASTIPGEFIIPRFLSEIVKRLPEVELKVDIADSVKIFEKVKEGSIEIGIIGTSYESEDVDFCPIIKNDKLVVIAPPDNPLVSRKELTLNDLKGQNFINRESGSGTRAAYERAFKDGGLSLSDLNIVAEIGTTEGIIHAVEGGAGLSVVSERSATQAIQLGRVIILDIPTLNITRDFYIITHKIQPLSQDGRKVVSVLKEVIK